MRSTSGGLYSVNVEEQQIDSITFIASNYSYASAYNWKASGYLASDQYTAPPLYFKVANVVVNQELIDIGQVTNSLANKVDLDGSNATFPRIIETYVNGTSGYNIWSNGYCEQWCQNYTVMDATATLTFLKVFKDTNYCITMAHQNEVNNDAGWVGVSAFTTTDFTYYNKARAGYSFWKASGYLAQGEY
jgi:hypothetical protein